VYITAVRSPFSIRCRSTVQSWPELALLYIKHCSLRCTCDTNQVLFMHLNVTFLRLLPQLQYNYNCDISDRFFLHALTVHFTAVQIKQIYCHNTHSLGFLPQVLSRGAIDMQGQKRVQAQDNSGVSVTTLMNHAATLLKLKVCLSGSDRARHCCLEAF